MSVRVITTVVTPATSYDLTTLAAVKDELSITGTASDVTLGRYITSASAAIAQYCNRIFPAETVKDEFWPDREVYNYQVPGIVPSLQLTRWPTGTVTSVTENGDTLAIGTDYRVDAANGSLIRLDLMLYPTAWCARPIVATYAGGFAATPADVEDAAIRMVKGRYLAKGRDPLLKQESIPGVREYQLWVATGSDAGNMPPDVADILDNYRVPVVA
jgi:hypothetical protein